MARNLTSGVLSSITASGKTPILLLVANFDSGSIYMWNGIGNLVYGGNTYIGGGQILSIDKLTEQKTLAATGLNIVLAGLDATVSNLMDNEPYQQRTFQLYLAMLDASGVVIASPYLLLDGFMDTMAGHDDGKSVQITLAIENVLIALERALNSTYTPEVQAIEFPGDTGFSFVANIQNKSVTWG